MGLDAFSMSAISVPRIKRKIMSMSKAEAEKLVERVMTLKTSQVKAEIEKFNKK